MKRLCSFISKTANDKLSNIASEVASRTSTCSNGTQQTHGIYGLRQHYVELATIRR